MRAALVGLCAIVAQAFGATAQFSIAIPQPLRVRTPFNVRITSGSSPTPFGGTYSFTLNGAPFLPVGSAPDGKTYSFLCQEPGVHEFGLHYSGDANYEPSSTYVTFEVLGKIATSVTTPAANPPSPGAGQPFTLTTVASAEEGFPQSGNVTFYNGGTLLAGAANTGNHVYSSTVQLPTGTHTITARFTVTGDYEGSVSPPLVLHVAKTTPSLTAPAITGTPRWGQPVTFTTKVTPAGAAPIRFFDGETQIGSALPDASGTATFTTSSLGLGPHEITARYAGNSNFEPAASPPSRIAIRGRLELALTSSRNPSPDAPVEFGVAVREPFPNAPARTGAIVLRRGDATLGTLPLTVSLPIGEHTLTAVYEGDALYEPVTSPPLIQRVTGSAPTTTALEITLGDTAQITARVASLTEPAPTGTIRIGETTLALTNGAATLTDATPLLGQRVAAEYSGDSIHAASSASNHLVLAPVNGFSFAFGSLAPSQIVTVFGDSLDSATVSIADRPAFVYLASPAQINFAAPDDLPTGPAALAITNHQGQTFSATVNIVPTAPGIASATPGSDGPPAAQLLRRRSGNARIETLNGPIVFNGDEIYLILYGTGFRHATGPVTCSITSQMGGVYTLTAAYAGAQGDYPGLDQINLRLDEALRNSGASKLACSAGSRASNSVSLVFP